MTNIIFYLFSYIHLFFGNTSRDQTPGPILTHHDSNDASSPTNVPFGGLKLTFNPFLPDFATKPDLVLLSVEEQLMVKNLIRERSLIVENVKTAQNSHKCHIGTE